MNQKNGLILWILGGAGIFLIYAAYKNIRPNTLLSNYISGGTASAPISNYTLPGHNSSGQSVPDGTPPGKYDNGYIYTDPPLPGKPSGGTHYDATAGFIVDSSGNPIGVVPPAYKANPSLYIGTGVVV